jgi:FkbM family methyltransferase
MRVPDVVRKVSDPLLQGVRVPIMSGVNRGMWWSLISSGSGYGSGRRARAQMNLFAALLRPTDVVWDVGAHHGFVTLCAARRAGAVHAFEPSAMNRALLERHVRWNELHNVTVHPFALQDHDGESTFGGTGTSKMFALGGGSEIVQVRTARTIVDEGRSARPSFAKIDVEGTEANALTGALSVLAGRARLAIAVHGAEQDARCSALLGAAGYELIPSRDLEASRRGPWRSDPDLYCIGPDVADRERDRAILRQHGF